MDRHELKSKKLPKIGLGISASGLGISVTLFLFLFLGTLPVPVTWDAETLPRCTMFLLVPFCVVGLIVSIVSVVVHRDLLSVLGIVLGLLATIASLLALSLVMVIYRFWYGAG